MGEEDIRARRDSIDSHILALSAKMDDYRKELQESLMEYHKNTRETHQRLYSRVETIEADIRDLRVQIAKFEPVLSAMQRHIETDVPVDVARDKAIAKAVIYIIGLCASGFIGWLFRSWG